MTYRPLTPAQRRLAAYRAKAVENVEVHTRPHFATANPEYLESSWPTNALAVARLAHAFARPANNGTWSEDRREYYATAWPDGWRVLGTSEEVCRKEGSRRVDHSGWYTSPEGDDGQTLSGYVLQIPARDGVAQYVAGTAHSEFDGVTIYPAARYDSPLDAASAADDHAKTDAEQEREYQTAWRAGQEWAEKGEEIATARKEALAILAERRAVKGVQAPALCKAIRAKVESLLDTIREAREEREKLESGDSERLYFYPDARLIAAFKEGANG